MKTNYKDTAKRYELAEKIVWDNLDPYKKLLVERDRKLDEGSRHTREFARAVVELAESETDLTKPTETYKEKEREVYNPPVYKDKFN